MRAVILIGGSGTRLRPLTYATPKALLPIVNKPLMAHLIANLNRHGVDEIVLAGSASDTRVEAALGNGASLGVSISYAYEGEPLGSGLAVKQAAAGFDEAFFVCNGDVATDIDLGAMIELHRQHAATLSIALSEVEDPSGFGVVELGEDDRLLKFVEKPPAAEAPSKWANAGTWLFEPEVLRHIPDQKLDGSLERIVFPGLIKDGFRVQGFRSDSYWLDIGTSERYMKAHRDLLAGLMPSWLPQGALVATSTAGHAPGQAHAGQFVLVGAGSTIEESAQVSGRSILGADCVLASEALVEDSVLWDNVRVGAGASIRGSIIGAGCVIGAGAVIDDAVLANGARVEDHVKLPPGTKLGPDEVAQ